MSSCPNCCFVAFALFLHIGPEQRPLLLLLTTNAWGVGGHGSLPKSAEGLPIWYLYKNTLHPPPLCCSSVLIELPTFVDATLLCQTVRLGEWLRMTAPREWANRVGIHAKILKSWTSLFSLLVFARDPCLQRNETLIRATASVSFDGPFGEYVGWDLLVLIPTLHRCLSYCWRPNGKNVQRRQHATKRIAGDHSQYRTSVTDPFLCLPFFFFLLSQASLPYFLLFFSSTPKPTAGAPQSWQALTRVSKGHRISVSNCVSTQLSSIGQINSLILSFLGFFFDVLLLYLSSSVPCTLHAQALFRYPSSVVETFHISAEVAGHQQASKSPKRLEC